MEHGEQLIHWDLPTGKLNDPDEGRKLSEEAVGNLLGRAEEKKTSRVS
jgi:hypothetical protein